MTDQLQYDFHACWVITRLTKEVFQHYFKYFALTQRHVSRKRQIEQALEKGRSGESTSMGAILIATKSLGSQDEIEGQKTNMDVVEKQRSIGLGENSVQKRSFMEQISAIFRPTSKKSQIRRLKPVGMNQDDGSVLSFFNTP